MRWVKPQMTLRHMTEENIHDVLRDLDVRCETELRHLGANRVGFKFMDFIGKPLSGTIYCDESPCALVILEPIGVKVWRSCFVFTHDIFDIWLPLTKQLKKST